ncbi:MAG: glycosyltransferase family 4 protein [Propionicimonas sp.]
MEINPIALWVIPVPDLGGVARHALDVAETGIPGWKLVFLCPPGPLAEALRHRGAAVLVADLGPQAGLPASLRSLRRTVRTLRPAVVHTHLAYADIAGALATRGLPVTLVSTEHGIADDDAVYHGSAARSKAMALAHRARIHAFDRLIAVSEATKAAMQTKWGPRQEIKVIRNGVDAGGPVTREPGGPLRVASLSRLSPEKRIDRLLDAFALVVAEQPDARLTVAGTGPLLADLKAQTVRLGIGEAVSFPGFVDASALLAANDVIVQLSVWENCSYTLLDACAAGLGVVATSVGGNPEILPPRCVVAAEDAQGVCAAVLSQGLDPTQRPTLPPGWPTRLAMADMLAATYEGAQR